MNRWVEGAIGEKARGWMESGGGEDYLRLCGQGQHFEAVPLEQILKITNKARPRARPRAFPTEGTAGAKAQRPGQT